MSPEAVERHLVVRKTARTYRLGELGPATREVWIACHGYGQLASRFIRSFQAIAGASRAVVAPEGLHRFYLDPPDRPADQRRVGATWMTRDDRDHDIADNVGYLDDVCAEVRSVAPAASITALGFSQGAATVSRWAVTSDLPLARVVLWGSDLPADLDWPRARRRFAAIALRLVIGDRDEFMTPARIAEDTAQLERHGIAHQWISYPGGHAIDENTLVRLAD